jgi:protein-disulfide isomerase
MTPDHRHRLLSFFVALSLLSVGLNGYFAWKLYRHRLRSWAAQWRTVPPARPDDHLRGPSDVAATVIVYSDFECPYCRKLHLRLKTLLATDSFRWVYRHSPGPGHPHAQRAAEASECAARQGRFWELADSLCETPLQDGTVDELVRRAEAVGIEGGTLRHCLESGGGAAQVRAQEKEARDLWITGTPTFFVNGRRVVGLIEVEEIQRLLKKGVPRPSS